MKELIEKLNHTGIKFLDLVDKGLDKLPDGIGALWEAAVIRARVTGVVSLSLAGIALTIGIVFVCIAVHAIGKQGNCSHAEELRYFARAVCYGVLSVFLVIGGAVNITRIDLWFMAFYPEQYILSELMLNFIK